MRLDGNGKVENDLAESYTIEPDNLTYTFSLKKNVKWHDGKDFTADDVVYTIQTIQNPNFNSPLRSNWKGVRVEKVDDYTIKFILKNVYSQFLNNLTFGILPKHLWGNLGENNFALAEYNLKAKGTGPFKVKRLTKDKDGKIASIEMIANEEYYGKKPSIEKLTFELYNDEDSVISAYNRREIKGINYLSPKNAKRIMDTEDSNIQRLHLPRYFAVFFNQTKSVPLSDKNVRLALSYATDKNKLVADVLGSEGTKIDTAISPGIPGYNQATKVYDYNVEEAKKILDAAGWIDSDNDGIREKGDAKISFTLYSTDWPEFIETTKMLQAMWKEVGANVEIKSLQVNDLQNGYIKTRNYEALLFGEVLNYNPDPFSFWHSSQKKDPGLNLALYDNQEADKILEGIRQEIDPAARTEKYNRFQDLVADDAPVIFLYSPYYLYVQSNSIKNANLSNIMTPADRFNSVENWYVTTTRAWK